MNNEDLLFAGRVPSMSIIDDGLEELVFRFPLEEQGKLAQAVSDGVHDVVILVARVPKASA